MKNRNCRAKRAARAHANNERTKANTKRFLEKDVGRPISAAMMDMVMPALAMLDKSHR